MDKKNHKLCVTMPVHLEENTLTGHFHKPPKTQLNTTLPSPALAQPWTFTFQLNLLLTPVWTQKLLLQSHIQSDVGLTCKAESTLDDAQRGKAEAATVEYYNYATLAD